MIKWVHGFSSPLWNRRRRNIMPFRQLRHGQVPDPLQRPGRAQEFAVLYHPITRENATPFSLSTPRRVPLPLQPAVDAKLQRMVDTGVIRSVDQPTDWCSGMVVVPKPDGRVRKCTDFTRLNQSVRRERHMLPSIEHLLADVQGATYFSKLDANSGFHQVPLDSESQLLTTFITPSGPGLEKSFLCQSQNFSGRVRVPFFWSHFPSSWSQSCAKTQKFRRKKKKAISLRPASAHTRTQTSSMKW